MLSSITDNIHYTDESSPWALPIFLIHKMWDGLSQQYIFLSVGSECLHSCV